jgi:hypothetical protein
MTVPYETRVGELVFTHEFADGYPTDETVTRLYDERDFQRVCQAYLWALPLVSMAQWQYAHNVTLGAENGQIVFCEGYRDKLGGLTYNTTTPYALPFIDLAGGPFVAEMPEGAIRGAAHDMWQIAITQITEPGRYLFVGPGQAVPDGAKAAGYQIFQSPTMSLLLGIRLMTEDPDERVRLLEQVAIYPYAERDDPMPRGYLRPEGREWLAAQPPGMTYWERLADVLGKEPVAERDRFFTAMLRPLGIEKGKPFAPDDRQRRLLEEAVFVGEAMAKANDFAKQFESAHYVDCSQWEYATVAVPDQRAEHHDELDERAAWLYEAVTNDIAMHGQRTGWGQVYMAAYKDSAGDWLDGAHTYQLRVPKDAPVEAFWSITLYDVATRCILRNDQEIADRSSRMDLLKDPDGGVTIDIGPEAPAGREQNWIPTVPGRAWFPYFRLYSPKQAFLDKTWVLPDIERPAT